MVFVMVVVWQLLQQQQLQEQQEQLVVCLFVVKVGWRCCFDGGGCFAGWCYCCDGVVFGWFWLLLL